MANDLVKLCRPTMSKNGNYALIPCVTKEGKFYTIIEELGKPNAHCYKENGVLVLRLDFKGVEK